MARTIPTPNARDQFWLGHLRACREQGQTLKAYAHAQGLSVSTCMARARRSSTVACSPSGPALRAREGGLRPRPPSCRCASPHPAPRFGCTCPTASSSRSPTMSRARPVPRCSIAWALWKVFEHETSVGGGAVSFITASSWLEGDAFRGMREHLRRVCGEVWILDLGGEGRGTRRSGNVFAIQTPVAIAVALRVGAGEEARPATVRHARLEGSREEKLAALDAVGGFGDMAWRECPEGWQAPFRPAGEGAYFGWLRLTDLMPWQHSGAQWKRTWPVGPDAETLGRRWRALLASVDPAQRARAFKETRDRKIDFKGSSLLGNGEKGKSIAELPLRRRGPNAARRGGRVRAGGAGGLRVRGVGPQGGAVVAEISDEGRHREGVLAAGRHPSWVLDLAVHHRAAGSALGAGSDRGGLAGAGEVA